MTPEKRDDAAIDVDEDVDEQFRALMEGLRTTLPGVQVLFAFLLTLPFQSGFSDLTQDALTAYLLAFGAAAVSSILLIAPSMHQRIRAPMTGVARHSAKHLRMTVWLTIAGSGAFLVALGAAVYLIAIVVLGTSAAALAVAAVALLAAWAWIYIPVVTFEKH